MAGGPGRDSLLDGVADRFENATDFTVGLEEEYQLLDPATLALTSRFEELQRTAPEALAPSLAGELIASEVEYRTGAHESLPAAGGELAEGRIALAAHADSLGIALGITGVHPFSPWQEQRIIDTPHYARVEGELGYIAWTNNTWSIHLHVGVRGADRAVAVSTAMRSVLPELLALSANSPIFLGRDSRLHSMRTQIFTKSFPRCAIPDPYRDWEEYAAFVRLLETTGSIVEGTQIWWSVRPHHSFGTVEVRICDGQSELADALAVAGLALASVAAFCRDHDDGVPLPAHPSGLIGENLWRAQRHGLAGGLIDLGRGKVRSTPDAIRELLTWSAEVHGPLGIEGLLAPIERTLVEGNGALRQLAEFAGSGDARALVAAARDRVTASAAEHMATTIEDGT